MAEERQTETEREWSYNIIRARRVKKNKSTIAEWT